MGQLIAKWVGASLRAGFMPPQNPKASELSAWRPVLAIHIIGQISQRRGENDGA